MKRPRFRTRLFLILWAFAVVPAVLITLAWATTVSKVVPLVSGTAAWDRVATTGEQAIKAARTAPLSPGARHAMTVHEQELASSLEQAKRLQFLLSRTMRVVAVGALILLGLLTLVASRVAGHLSRQLSRPLDELVRWTDTIARGEPLPEQASSRGAPEFEMLRLRMRRMARDLETGRARALEAERLSAFRETARQVAHELKNPLTPIRFAVDRLRREVPPSLTEPVEVIAAESQRLERMARSFSQFGRLPEGPAAPIEIGELVRYTARATVPEDMPLQLEIEPDLPMVYGQYDALARALSNVLINAVEASPPKGTIRVRAERVPHNGSAGAVSIAVRDAGCGITPERLARIWEPYVTDKAGGTGLGLAIARQTIVAHHGSVDAVSAVGQGTEIRFTLPAEEQTG